MILLIAAIVWYVSGILLTLGWFHLDDERFIGTPEEYTLLIVTAFFGLGLLFVVIPYLLSAIHYKIEERNEARKIKKEKDKFDEATT